MDKLDRVRLDAVTRKMFVADSAGVEHEVFELNATVAAKLAETPEAKELLDIAWEWIENREVGRTDPLWGMKLRQKNGFIATPRFLHAVKTKQTANV